MRSAAIVLVSVLIGCTDTSLNTGPDLAAPFGMGCSSGGIDGQETDADCGGPDCKSCDAGKGCKLGRDCASGFCTNNICDPPSCTDKVKNGMESDVDCGGGGCDGCADGQSCNAGTDCKSATCTNGRCAPTPCSNGVRDGAETDVDCGGGTCAPCDDGKSCAGGADCKSGMCTNAVCKGAVMCPAGMGDCDGNAGNGCETNLNTDAKNCGKCGMACPMNAPACVAGKCTANCLGGLAVPMPCAGGKDPKGLGGTWVVCTADCMTAWLSVKAGTAPGQFHPILICQSLGYSSTSKFGGTGRKECGYGMDQAPSCAMPGTMLFDGSGRRPDDEFGMVIGESVMWQCTK